MTAPPVTAPAPATSARMARVRSRDTGPELALRRELHRRGLRFRLPAPGRRLPGSPDIVLGRVKVAVFVDGCFWHGCPAHFRAPATNRGFWLGKVAGNVARDQRVDAELAEAGWAVVRVWEHEPAGRAADRVAWAWARRQAHDDPGWLAEHLRDDHGRDPGEAAALGGEGLRALHAALTPPEERSGR